MQIEGTISDVAARSLIALATEYLTKGGRLEGVDEDSLVEAITTLGECDRIVIVQTPEKKD